MRKKKLNFFFSKRVGECTRRLHPRARGGGMQTAQKACRTEQGRCLSEHLSRSTERVETDRPPRARNSIHVTSLVPQAGAFWLRSHTSDDKQAANNRQWHWHRLEATRPVAQTPPQRGGLGGHDGPERVSKSKGNAIDILADPQTGVAPGWTRGRHMRSRCRCSMCSAIHINSRS